MIGAPNSLNLNCKVHVMKEALGPSVSEEIADIFTNYNIDYHMLILCNALHIRSCFFSTTAFKHRWIDFQITLILILFAATLLWMSLLFKFTVTVLKWKWKILFSIIYSLPGYRLMEELTHWPWEWFIVCVFQPNCCETSNISCTLVGNKYSFGTDYIWVMVCWFSSFWHHCDLVKQVKCAVSRHFRDNVWEEWAEICHVHIPSNEKGKF